MAVPQGHCKSLWTASPRIKTVIEVRKLVKRFGGKTVLRGLDFDVQPGEFVALLGPNGSGKTTFLRILSSLSHASMGRCPCGGL